MNRNSTSDESFASLHWVGWSVGEVAETGAAGLVWIVSGSCGVNRIEAQGSTQPEAWHVACQQAVGMHRKARPS